MLPSLSTPLHISCITLDYALLQKQIRLSRNLNALNENRNSALHIAVRNNWSSGVRALLLAGADPNVVGVEGQSPLHVVSGNDHIFRLLISYGADLSMRDHRLRTPLHWAVNHSDLLALNACIQGGCLLGALDENGHTPLFWAVQNANREIVSELLRAGAPLDQDCSYTVRDVVQNMRYPDEVIRGQILSACEQDLLRQEETIVAPRISAPRL